MKWSMQVIRIIPSGFVDWPFRQSPDSGSASPAESSGPWCITSPPRSWVCWCAGSACGHKRHPCHPSARRRRPTSGPPLDPDLLGDEASGLAALPGVGALQEQELRLVEDVHQHRELRVHQRLQALLQSVDDVLRHTHTHALYINITALLNIKCYINTRI